MGETLLGATLKKLAPRVKYRLHKPVIENVAFRIHYMATVTMFIGFVLLVCATEYFGDYMKCTGGGAVPDKVLETYCYFMGTFSADKYFDNEIIKTGSSYPGVGSYINTDSTSLHKYYQWVPFVLFFQCICFYMPHYIWKLKEGGRLKSLVEGMQYATLARDVELKCKTGTIPSKDSITKKMDTVKRDVLLRLRLSKTWSTWLVAMEVTNLLHIIMEIWAMNCLLDKKFISLGFNVIGFEDWKADVNPFNSLFPYMSKCNFYKFGASGSLMNMDALCVMTFNVLYERIYIIMWFWFLFLLIISALAVVWRIISFFLYRYSLSFSELMFRNANSAKLDRRTIMLVVESCQFGDWLFLYYLAKNMKPSVFKELFTHLAEQLQKGQLDEFEDSHCLKPSEKQFVDAYPSIGFNDEVLHKDQKKSF